jgi:nitrate reductase gamma subunit
MVLANRDHHYDLDKEVRVLTIPKDYLLLLVLAALVVGSTLGLILASMNQIYNFWSFSFVLLLLMSCVKEIKIKNNLQQMCIYNLLARVN